MCGNGCLETSGQKSHPAIRSVDLNFLNDGYISTIGWRLRHIFDVFVHNFHLTLWLWLRPFDLGGVDELSFIHPTHRTIVSILRLYGWLNLITLTSHGTVTMTWPVYRGSSKATSNSFLTPNYLFTIQLLWGLRRRLTVVLYWCIPMLKRFSAANNCPVKIGPQNGGYSAAGLRPDPLVEPKRSTDPLAAIRGPTSKGRERGGEHGDAPI